METFPHAQDLEEAYCIYQGYFFCGIIWRHKNATADVTELEIAEVDGRCQQAQLHWQQICFNWLVDVQSGVGLPYLFRAIRLTCSLGFNY